MIGVIQAVQEQEITLDSNTAVIPFANNDLRSRSATCCGWMNHNEGSGLFSILESGYYNNNFGTLITSATPGIVAVGLFADGSYIFAIYINSAFVCIIKTHQKFDNC